MGLLTFFGCLLTAYAPLVVFYALYIGRNAQLVILFVSSAFFWLLAMLFASVWWYIIPQMQGIVAFTIVFSVLFQELFRWLFVLILKRSEKGLAVVARFPGKLRWNEMDHAIAAGLGFGAMSSLMSYIAVLAETTGPGVLQAATCPGISLSYLLALTTMFFSMLNVVWMVIAVEGYRQRKYLPVVLVIVWHLAASYITMFNNVAWMGGCAVNLSLLALMTCAGLGYLVMRAMKLKDA